MKRAIPLFKSKSKRYSLLLRWAGGILAGTATFFLFLALFQLFSPLSARESVPLRTQMVTIPIGTSMVHIAANLCEQKLISSPFWFRFYARLLRYDRHIKAGYFSLNPTMSLWHILKELGKNEAANTMVRITFPEGLSVTQMGQILESKHIFSSAEFCRFVYHAKPIFDQKYPFLARCPTDNLEGFIFPDTYYVAQGIDIGSFVDMCLHQFDRKMIPIWNRAQSRIKEKYGFYQVLTMASLLEKEAQHSQELPTIASVFYNRLSRGMQLASDPTVLYALGFATKPTVTYRDLKVESDYNTYRQKGLPPTPIASPSSKAFFAALHPEDTDFLFFVADGQGGHHFTKSYKAHLAVQNGGR